MRWQILCLELSNISCCSALFWLWSPAQLPVWCFPMANTPCCWHLHFLQQSNIIHIKPGQCSSLLPSAAYLLCDLVDEPKTLFFSYLWVSRVLRSQLSAKGTGIRVVLHCYSGLLEKNCWLYLRLKSLLPNAGTVVVGVKNMGRGSSYCHHSHPSTCWPC